MGSYNYLGFAENRADFLQTVADTMHQYGAGICSTRQEMGEFVANVLCTKDIVPLVLFSLFQERRFFISRERYKSCVSVSYSLTYKRKSLSDPDNTRTPSPSSHMPSFITFRVNYDASFITLLAKIYCLHV